ncbi:DNA-3-methyladenine glycosylase [Verrucomicrobium sp. BvORR106]|uniref:DNA-3-methyladenine glycosylase n=1 Tax=Verrucomicrobium sp. BvORR106 TaxID=1403819 RepID=UPI00068AD885|nr:DNA-3-methyladenine glycosylase [Verrucomicrobium sp. BvORR106]
MMLKQDFFQRDVLTVARDLIGVELVWHGCSGVIVETEAYAEAGDAASHTATRPSAREFIRLMSPGTAYVYFNYGMYWLFNLLVKGGPQNGMILIRALEPRTGIPLMQQRRGRENLRDLCSGPGKLAMAMGITGEAHGTPLVGPHQPAGVGLRRPAVPLAPGQVVAEDIRVGISQAVDFQWRFVAAGHAHLSVPHGRVKVPDMRQPHGKTSPGRKKKPPSRKRTRNGG